MRTSWHKLSTLSRRERWLLVQAGVLLPITAVALRWLGLRRWHAVLARWARPGAGAGATEAQATARLVRAATVHGPFPASCLPQSLTLWWLLRRQGIACDLRIGVRKDSDGMEAHAWVEHHGQVLGDGDGLQRRYVPFAGVIEPVGRGAE